MDSEILGSGTEPELPMKKEIQDIIEAYMKRHGFHVGVIILAKDGGVSEAGDEADAQMAVFGSAVEEAPVYLLRLMAEVRAHTPDFISYIATTI